MFVGMHCVFQLLKAVFLAQLLYGATSKWQIEENIVEKDLYKILGLSKTATLKEIQKSFRKLAQKHHPDKAKPDNAKHNESIFRELAEAYEVLSTKAQREEYDARRKLLSSDEVNSRKETDFPRSSGFNSPDAFYNDYLFDDFENEPDSFSQYQNPDYFQPSVTGPYLNAKQIIFPYDPILATIDRHTFALLDETCSIVIYQGDLEAFIRNTLLYGSGLGMNSSAVSEFDELYRTPQFTMLGGNCFAGLDDAGYLHIFRGQPIGVYHSVWSSFKHDAQGMFGFERYQLQLLRAGELRIHEVRVIDQVCVWSSASASCSAYISSARMAVTKTRIALQKACTFTNLLNLPSRIARSNMVKYMWSSVSALQQKIRIKVDVVVCYMKHAWGKYIIPRMSSNANGDKSENDNGTGSSSSLEACISAAHSKHAQSKENGRKRRSKIL